MPLIEPVELRDPRELGHVHFIGVGGAGMSGIAAMYARLGVQVSGSDQAYSLAFEELRALGADMYVGHDAAHLGDAATVVVSTAVRETNVELAAARSRGLLVWHRSAALGALMLGHDAVAVSGTHGKTTTSAMIAAMLDALGADPSFVVGSPVAGFGTSDRLGGGRAFVIEADESDGSFLQYPPGIAVVTNVEADHLDNWGTAAAYARGMADFARRASTAVVCGDDEGARRLIDSLRAAGTSLLVVGECEDADVRLSDVDADGPHARATVTTADGRGPLELQIPGRHNLANAAAAYAVAMCCGFAGDGAGVRRALGQFGGTSRRFETVADVAGVRIVDDYAHHPTEVIATMRTARAVASGARLVVCFQPHLFTRTRDFADELGQALSMADVAVVLDVYPSREDPIPGVTGQLVADAALKAMPGCVTYVPQLVDAPGVLAGLVREGDFVLTMGAGSVTGVGPRLADLLENR